MMQLICNGVALDLPAGAGLQFTQENPLFSFDNLKCERTTQFKLPATATNDRVFSLARVPAYAGEGMRRKFDAQLQAGAVVKNGYLYVSNFDGKEYNAVFVTGELIGLQEIKNAGKLRDIFGDDLGSYDIQASGEQITAQTKTQTFGQYNYQTSGLVFPSFAIKSLIDRALQKLGAPAARYDVIRYARIIPNELEVLREHEMRLKRAESEYVLERMVLEMPGGLMDDFLTQENRTLEFNTYLCYEDRDDPTHIIKQRTISYETVGCLVPRIDISLDFPNDFPDVMIIAPDGTLTPQFLGSRVMDIYGNVTGERLAGGSVDIPAGTAFFIVFAADFQYRMDEQPLPYPQTWYEYWGWNMAVATIDRMVSVSSKSEATAGTRIAVGDNLPDITLTDLCKVYAALTGTVLSYDGERIIFDALNLAAFNTISLDAIMERGEVSRGFSDYARRNTIEFESGDAVYDVERLRAVYEIDNDTLAEEKELMKIPFSEGGTRNGYLFVRDWNDQSVIGSDNVEGAEVWPYMQRVSLPINNGVRELCEASTQVQMQARMTLFQYTAIKADTAINLENTRYVWTSKQWQKDAAIFTLARIN